MVGISKLNKRKRNSRGRYISESDIPFKNRKKEYMVEWRDANRENIKEYSKKYREENREKNNKRRRAKYYEKNKETIEKRKIIRKQKQEEKEKRKSERQNNKTTKICKRCGKEFISLKSRNRKYCSNKCGKSTNLGNFKYNIDEKLLRKYYIDDGLSVEKCAKEFGCSSMPIRLALKRYNIDKRGISESLKLLYRDKKNHPCYERKMTKELREKIGNSQPNKGTNICYNTGRTQFKVGQPKTENMKKAASKALKKLWIEKHDYMASIMKDFWSEHYDYMVSTRRRGKNHPAWNENIDFVKRARNYLYNYTNWRDEVFKRDKYTCYICGNVGKRLNAHHVYPFTELINDFLLEHDGNEEELYEQLKSWDRLIDTSIGITLCEECHHNLHWGD